VGMVGPLAMGACRGLSLLLGAAAAGEWAGLAQPPVLVAALMLTLYIAAVTLLARHEAEAVPIGMKRYLPAAVLAAGFAVLGSLPAPVRLAAWFVFLLLALCAIEWAIACARPLAETPAPQAVQKAIGSLLRNLVVIQAALATVGGDPGKAFRPMFLWAGELLWGTGKPAEPVGEQVDLAHALAAVAEFWPGIVIAAVLLLVALPVTRWLARRFYAS